MQRGWLKLQNRYLLVTLCINIRTYRRDFAAAQVSALLLNSNSALSIDRSIESDDHHFALPTCCANF
jgi:hypothetical protein